MNMVLVNYVSYYATQVRGFLRYHSSEVVEELTGGLEADLIEAMSESEAVRNEQDITLDDLIARFGTPQSYAQELCESAGVDFEPATAESKELFSKETKEKKRPVSAVVAKLKAGAGWLAEPQRFSPAIRDFYQTARPAWWGLRAWLVYLLASMLGHTNENRPFPNDLAHGLLFVALLVGSFAVGMKWRAASVAGRTGKVIVVLNAFLLLLLPFPYLSMQEQVNNAWSEGYNEGARNAQDDYYAYTGEEISFLNPAQPTTQLVDVGASSNLFVYNADGEFVPDARIVNETGTSVGSTDYPVRLDRRTNSVALLNARKDQYGRDVLNVFPVTFTQVDIAQDACTPEDQEFWNGLMSGHIYEEWDYDIEDPQDLATQFGLLKNDNRKAQFRYGKDAQEFLIGGATNLTTNEDCLYGFKRPKGFETEAPYILTLPKLAETEKPRDSKDPASQGNKAQAGKETDADAVKGAAEKKSAEDTAAPKTEKDSKSGSAPTSDTPDEGSGE